MKFFFDEKRGKKVLEKTEEQTGGEYEEAKRNKWGHNTEELATRTDNRQEERLYEEHNNKKREQAEVKEDGIPTASDDPTRKHEGEPSEAWNNIASGESRENRDASGKTQSRREGTDREMK